jgi:hypothetical protein
VSTIIQLPQLRACSSYTRCLGRVVVGPDRLLLESVFIPSESVSTRNRCLELSREESCGGIDEPFVIIIKSTFRTAICTCLPLLVSRLDRWNINRYISLSRKEKERVSTGRFKKKEITSPKLNSRVIFTWKNSGANSRMYYIHAGGIWAELPALTEKKIAGGQGKSDARHHGHFRSVSPPDTYTSLHAS